MRLISATAAIVMCCAPYAQPNLSATSTIPTPPSGEWTRSGSLIFVNDDGVESLAFGKTATGELFPLIATDEDRSQNIIDGGKVLATSRKMKMRLVEFGSRSDVGELTPR